ncbi:MAG TPA: CocE/NonD family hydrolase [Mycobacteriales bacterium]|nr:CocE/NonD family hydrolase [Mycobacteriales bacterium]
MKEAGRWLWDVRTPMRDGVELSTDLHLPPGGLAGGPYPTVLIRTAANNQAPMYVTRARKLADTGFAVAIQDIRGRQDADGVFAPFRNEGPDGYDSVEWLAAQEWSTGKVATMGSGYDAWAQWAAARERPPHLTTMVSTSAWAPGRQSRSGALPLSMLAWLHAMSARVWQEAGHVDWEVVLRHLPMRGANEAISCRLPVWHEWLDARPATSFWHDLDLSADDFAAIDIPVLHITGWHDFDQHSALRYYSGMRAHSPAASGQSLVIGGEEPADLHCEWFDHWLSGSGSTQSPRSRYFVTGTDSWQDGDWAAPPDGVTTWYLHSAGRANTLNGDGTLTAAAPVDEPADTYVYDPADPVIVSTDLTFFPSLPRQPPELPLDRRFVERRPDVLIYTTAPLTAGTTLRGCPALTLFVSSDRVDTDWFVQLSDVAPGDDSMLLATGGLRSRHREGLDREVSLHPGETHEIAIELSAVAHVLRPGHRLRIAIMSSYFPLFDRNLNTGAAIGQDANPLVATNTVHHDATRPSRLVLPFALQEDSDA